MKNSKIVLFILLLSFGMLLNCEVNVLGVETSHKPRVVGSGDIVTVDKTSTDFNKIDISQAFVATITQSENYLVELRVDDNIVNKVFVVRQGSALKVYLDDDYSYQNATLEIDIHLPDIEQLQLSGASVAAVEGFDFDHEMEFVLSGASIVNGDLSCGNVDFYISGASRITLNGTGEDLDMDVSGASTVALDDFLCDDVDITLSGASSASVNSQGTISADLSGASRLYYYGNPVLGNISMSGASEIKKKG